MDFAFDAKTEELRAELLDFMVSQLHPAEPVFAEQLARIACWPDLLLYAEHSCSSIGSPDQSERGIR